MDADVVFKVSMGGLSTGRTPKMRQALRTQESTEDAANNVRRDL